jgi:integrase
LLSKAAKVNVIGIKEPATHDLRRTFAKLVYKGSAGLDQLQLLLGHASIKTTEKYPGVSQNLTDAPCEHLGLLLGDD